MASSVLLQVSVSRRRGKGQPCVASLLHHTTADPGARLSADPGVGHSLGWVGAGCSDPPDCARRPGQLGGLRQSLPRRAETRKAFDTPAFSMPEVTRAPGPLSSRPTLALAAFPLLWMPWQEAFSLPSPCLAGSSSSWALACCTPSLHARTRSRCSPRAACPPSTLWALLPCGTLSAGAARAEVEDPLEQLLWELPREKLCPAPASAPAPAWQRGAALSQPTLAVPAPPQSAPERLQRSPGGALWRVAAGWFDVGTAAVVPGAAGGAGKLG